MSALKAIETEYKGYRFRSRLEARWAVFFDACGVKWEYEPEGYVLSDGGYYLPDFLLHDVTFNHAGYSEGNDLYVEVKGKMTAEDAEKIKKFAFPPKADDGECWDPDKIIFIRMTDLTATSPCPFLWRIGGAGAVTATGSQTSSSWKVGATAAKAPCR